MSCRYSTAHSRTAKHSSAQNSVIGTVAAAVPLAYNAACRGCLCWMVPTPIKVCLCKHDRGLCAEASIIPPMHDVRLHAGNVLKLKPPATGWFGHDLGARCTCVLPQAHMMTLGLETSHTCPLLHCGCKAPSTGSPAHIQYTSMLVAHCRGMPHKAPGTGTDGTLQTGRN